MQDELDPSSLMLSVVGFFLGLSSHDFLCGVTLRFRVKGKGSPLILLALALRARPWRKLP